MRRSHRIIPLAPHGFRADGDCLRLGLLIGSGCLLSCWPVMLACGLGHTIAAMVCSTSLVLAERYIVMLRPGLLFLTVVLCAVLWVTSAAFFLRYFAR
jgi:hypothetical protein